MKNNEKCFITFGEGQVLTANYAQFRLLNHAKEIKRVKIIAIIALGCALASLATTLTVLLIR